MTLINDLLTKMYQSDANMVGYTIKLEAQYVFLVTMQLEVDDSKQVRISTMTLKGQH